MDSLEGSIDKHCLPDFILRKRGDTFIRDYGTVHLCIIINMFTTDIFFN